MDALIYVGPMERDVEFKIIPKMETLTLVEAIEEVEDVAAEEESTVSVDVKEEYSESQVEAKDNKNLIIAIMGVVAVIIIGALIVFKVKKK